MVSQRVVADHLDLSSTAVHNLVRRGVIPRGEGRAGLDLDACRVAYLRHLREQAAGRMGASEDLDLAAERARLAAAQADAQEMKNSLTRGNLLPADEVQAGIEMMIARCRAKLLGLPARLAPEVVGLERLAEVVARIDDAVREALEELADQRFEATTEEDDELS